MSTSSDRAKHVEIQGGAPPKLTERSGLWCWEGRRGRARFRFYGKATASGNPTDPLDTLEPDGIPVAWLHQRHTSVVLSATVGGNHGTGDALVTRVPRLALRVATADCVPVLLLSDDCVAAVHAGWRGIAADIVVAAVRQWPSPLAPTAIIGPAIGACCYEVGDEVAQQVARTSGSGDVVCSGQGERPHLDLQLAVAHQLARCGIATASRISSCTRCEELRLWSYRRDGPEAGRNLALAWLEA